MDFWIKCGYKTEDGFYHIISRLDNVKPLQFQRAQLLSVSGLRAKRLVELYKRRMAVERAFKASKQELSMEKPKWKGISKNARCNLHSYMQL